MRSTDLTTRILDKAPSTLFSSTFVQIPFGAQIFHSHCSTDAHSATMKPTLDL